jgi:hypothetical protein
MKLRSFFPCATQQPAVIGRADVVCAPDAKES